MNVNKSNEWRPEQYKYIEMYFVTRNMYRGYVYLYFDCVKLGKIMFDQYLE